MEVDHSNLVPYPVTSSSPFRGALFRNLTLAKVKGERRCSDPFNCLFPASKWFFFSERKKKKRKRKKEESRRFDPDQLCVDGHRRRRHRHHPRAGLLS